MSPPADSLLYPQWGTLPEINPELEILPPQVTEACVCIGSLHQETLWARWLGRNHHRNVQFWSATKIIPLLNVASRVGDRLKSQRHDSPHSPLQHCLVRSPDSRGGMSFLAIARNIVAYRNEWRPSKSSNALSAVLKRFETYEGLERWVKDLTGNEHLEFRGNYGRLPPILFPELIDPATQTVLLKAAPLTEKGHNRISAYDLTRLMSMLGWHRYLPVDCRLPSVDGQNFQPILWALREDPARYLDRAIAQLRPTAQLHPVILLSKVGYGPSDERQTDELTYTAFVQLRYKSHQTQSLALTLRTVLLNGGKPNSQRRLLDQIMTRAVTGLLHSLVLGAI
jgi:hypothetical protein